MIKNFLILISISFLAKMSSAQMACMALGQNPSTAFPVCGTAVFSQSTVPLCGGTKIPCPSCADPFTDINPFWYKFTCFSSGTLGFVIMPNDQLEDYDWQLFDVTNHDPEEVYTNTALFVACDWSGDVGNTGASSSGNSLIRCDNAGVPLFTSMPALIKGHNYLLLVSHFTQTQSGYALTFGGGTAVITDSTAPHLQSATATCDNTHVIVMLNKKMKCSSLSGDGSEFTISSPLTSVVAASSGECDNGFDLDSIALTLSNALPPGNYTLTIQNGTDQNTLLDNCDNEIPPAENIPLIITPIQPTLMDSITTVSCAPDVLQLVFKTGILCNTIAADGSDFVVTGPHPVTVVGAAGVCSNGTTKVINIQLAEPIKLQGDYQVRLFNGSDGNTLINECGQPTPAGSSLNFSTKDTVSAAFTYQLKLGCKVDTVDYVYNERDGVNMWQWDFENNITSTLQDPVIQYTSYGAQQASLLVSNGFCSDTFTNSYILLDNQLNASFEGTNLVCPGTAANFKDNSIGTITSWSWNFGNGNTSTDQLPPPQTYFIINKVSEVPVTLTIQNTEGCIDSLTQYVEVVDNCYIAVPSAFTPNGDGLNDYLYPLNAYKATDLTFKVYNRYGQLVFETNDWTNKWNGTFKGQPANAGAYVWLLQYTDRETGKKYFTKGSSILIR